jgi:N-acetylneuraminic acid mutarotase
MWPQSYLKTVEVINLDPANPGLVCDKLPEFPVYLKGCTGQLFNKSTPMICGGWNGYYSCDCYALQNQSWTKISSLNQCRGYPASALVSLEEEEEVLMITGGSNGSKILKSVESFDGKNWEQGQLPELPIGIWDHCLVKINATTLLIIGGRESASGKTAKTHFFHADKNKWSPGANVIKQFTAISYKFS